MKVTFRFPSSWSSLLQQTLATPSYYLSFAGLVQLCRKLDLWVSIRSGIPLRLLRTAFCSSWPISLITWTTNIVWAKMFYCQMTISVHHCVVCGTFRFPVGTSSFLSCFSFPLICPKRCSFSLGVRLAWTSPTNIWHSWILKRYLQQSHAWRPGCPFYTSPSCSPISQPPQSSQATIRQGSSIEDSLIFLQCNAPYTRLSYGKFHPSVYVSNKLTVFQSATWSRISTRWPYVPGSTEWSWRRRAATSFWGVLA